MGSYVKRTEEYPLKGRPLLGRLDMELTERCNNNCIHCYINLPADDPCKARELSAEKIKAILSEAASLGCLTVRFTGGEPLLRNDFQEIYLFARRLGLEGLALHKCHPNHTRASRSLFSHSTSKEDRGLCLWHVSEVLRGSDPHTGLLPRGLEGHGPYARERHPFCGQGRGPAAQQGRAGRV